MPVLDEAYKKFRDRIQGKTIDDKEANSLVLNRPITEQDIQNGTVFAVDHSDPNNARRIKHKGIVVSYSDGFFSREWEDNTDFSANDKGKLLFYVEEGHKNFFCKLIDKCMKDSFVGESAQTTTILADLGNKIITEIKKFTDTATGQLLSLYEFPNIQSAQTSYVKRTSYVDEEGNKVNVRELDSERLESIETESKAVDSESVKSGDSGVSSQTKVSEDENGKPKNENLYPGEALEDLKSNKEQATAQPSINIGKAAVKTVQGLKGWLEENKYIAQDNMGGVRVYIDTLDKLIQNGADLSSGDAKNKVNTIVGIIKHGFKAEIQTLNKAYKSPLENCIDAALKTDDDEGKFKGIIQLVYAITKEVPDLIEECKQSNAEFKSKHEDYNDYSSRIDALFDALVANIDFDAKRKELTLARDDWKKSLDEFVPIRGHVKPQGGLSEKIAKSKARVKTEYLALLEKNHSILKEELQGDVKALKDSAEKLQVEEGSEIEKDKGQVLEEIATLLKNVDKATPAANENIKKLKEQYNNLSGDVASIKQKLDRQQAEVTFCNTTLFPAMSLIQKKALELKKGNAAACEKGKLLLQIKDKISDIHNNIVSGEASDLTVYIKAAKDCITTNEEGISSYRSQWGSRYFYTMFGVNLKNRVESFHLINKLNQELADYESKLEPPVAQASI